MTELQAGIRGSVLENLLDGVMVVERGGAITVFNGAAGRILGLSPGDVEGRTFAELFIARDGFEAFSELILDAVGDGSEGGRQEVDITAGGAARSLSVATSYIRPALGCSGEPVALIAVFSDVTEVRELRETELRMAQEVEAQNAELQTAYRRIEERNAALSATLKKVQVARIMATVLVIGVFLGAGAFVWQPLDLFGGSLFGGSSGSSMMSTADAGAVDGLRTMTVEPQPVRTTISLVGKLAPWRTVNVASPVGGRVSAVHVQYGQEVAEGDLLVELNTADTTRRHRQARVSYIEALEAFELVRDWDTGPEMAEARRSLARARISLENQERQLKRKAFLLEQGLIAASEHEDAERQHQRQQLDFEAARQEFEAARARGGKAALDKAALVLSSAEEEMLELEQGLGEDRVYAPVAGAVLAPSRAGAREIFAGLPVTRGDVLLTIGDFSRMAATAKVDEVDVVRIAVGQAVSVRGNAFRDLRLKGTVTHVSSQPDPKVRGAPRFDVVVTLEPLEAEERGQIRTGMSSRLRIVVYSKDAALMVPIDAVEQRGRGHRVLVIDRASGEVREREVEVGPTTRDSVEVVAGLQAGDEVVVSDY